ncbi:MAG: hypothetical protein ACRDE2_14090 [Chitinophagaceae bacterium]
MSEKLEPTEAISLPVKEISDQVKISILLVYGINNPSPDSLANNALMANFSFNDYQWIELAFSLTKIIRKYNPHQSLTAPDLQNMVAVQDCIDLVLQKSKP